MIQEIELRYWELRRELKMSNDITPTNLNEEKKIFLDAVKNNTVYNPEFKYKKKSSISFLKDLNDIKKEFATIDHILSDVYIEGVTGAIEWVEHFENRKSIGNWISNLYGKPPGSLYDYAHKKIKELNPIKTVFNIPSEETGVLIKQQLTKYNFNDWNVIIVNNAARMSVNSLERKIKIKNNTLYSNQELERLFVHEIGTHVWRAENGSKQNYDIFQFGLPYYTATEEGLALYAEEKNGLQNDNDMLKYCLRVIACYESFEKGFYDLFKSINKYIDKSIAFDIVARIKRGYTLTDKLGGYTKDQVYLQGYIEVEKLSDEERKKLYVGKIGIQHIDLLQKISDINYDIPLPEWIK